MEKYIKNLVEYTGERELIVNMKNMFNIDEDQANKLVSYLDFGDYVALDVALKHGDEARARSIIGKNIDSGVEEGANSYSSSPSTSSGPTQTNNASNTTTKPEQDINVGDKVSFVDDEGKSEEGQVADDDAEGVAVNANNRQKIIPKDQLAPVDEELNRMLELSGIPIEERKDRVMGVTKYSPPSAIHSASMSGGCMPQKKLRDITRTKKDMKPGPKTK